MKKTHNKKPPFIKILRGYKNAITDFLSKKQDFISHIPSLHLRSLGRFDKKQWQHFARLNGYGFVFGLCFSAWLYVFVFVIEGLGGFSEHSSVGADMFYCALLSVFGLISVASYLFCPARIRFYFGFFAGLLLLYWIALSFRYSPFPFLIPFVWLGIGCIIGAIFWALLYFGHIIFRIFSIMILGYIHPFGFDWLVPQSFFAYSFFGISHWDFLLIVVGVALVVMALGKNDIKGFLYIAKKSKKSFVKFRIGAGFFGVLSLILAFENVSPANTISTPFLQNDSNDLESTTQITKNQIALAQTHFPQDVKWSKHALDSIKNSTFKAIEQAKIDGKKAIILPETILPIVLNSENPYEIATLESLKNASNEIAIILGAFSKPNFNSTYVIHKGEVRILNKVILAPFGEKMPLPDFLAKPLLRAFFGIDEGLDSASKPQDFNLFGLRFRNAICYEGTSNALYEDNPKFVVMISNNGWFYVSIEPYLQRVLLKYYARKVGAMILHSANLSQSFVMTPQVLGDSYGEIIHIGF
ncbi:apolipoprotein N-acyltransferase [Helicobacter sp. T3_23-1056]